MDDTRLFCHPWFTKNEDGSLTANELRPDSYVQITDELLSNSKAMEMLNAAILPFRFIPTGERYGNGSITGEIFYIGNWNNTSAGMNTGDQWEGNS